MFSMTHRQKSTARLAIISLTIFALIFTLTASVISANNSPLLKPVTAATAKKQLNIVALGDSLAAGYELGFDINSVPYGFVEHVYEQALFNGYRATLNNYGVLGLTSAGLNNWLTAIEKQATTSPDAVQAGLIDPRADQLIGDTVEQYKKITEADLIVLAIGGNDFLSVLKNVDLSSDSTALTKEGKQAIIDELELVVTSYETQLIAILQSIVKLNPSAAIVTQNHYLPLPTTMSFGNKSSYLNVPTDISTLLEKEQAKLNAVFEKVINSFQENGVNIGIVDASSIISPRTLSLTNIFSKDPHPNSKGYLELGKGYGEALFGQFKTVTPRNESTPISVVVNGIEVISPYPTKLINGRTYLVLRDISDAMGANLAWDNKTQTATMKNNGHTISISIGAKHITVNGEQRVLQAEPAFLEDVNGEKKTYVPIAALSEGFGFHVVYRHQPKIAFINE